MELNFIGLITVKQNVPISIICDREHPLIRRLNIFGSNSRCWAINLSSYRL
jgi:hypothetical protein